MERRLRRARVLLFALLVLLLPTLGECKRLSKQRSRLQTSVGAWNRALPSVLVLRGGRKHDCAEEAAELFDNMRVPSALVAGSIVPLVSFAGPRVAAADMGLTVLLKKLHFFVAAFSLFSSLTACLYATVAFNTLTERHPEPAETVAEVLQRDYELSWVGCNVCFYLALVGLVVTVCISGLLALGLGILVPTACLFGSVVLLWLAVVNNAVDNEGLLARGWGFERFFGESVVTLCVRYVRLLLRAAFSSQERRSLMMPSVLLALAFIVTARLELMRELAGTGTAATLEL